MKLIVKFFGEVIMLEVVFYGRKFRDQEEWNRILEFKRVQEVWQ